MGVAWEKWSLINQTVNRYWEEQEIDFEYTIQPRSNVLIINN